MAPNSIAMFGFDVNIKSVEEKKFSIEAVGTLIVCLIWYWMVKT